MGMTVGKHNGIIAAMNVVPLIDVLLVLLIIFMVIAPLTPEGLEARIPQQSDEQAPLDPRVPDPTVVVQVRTDGRVLINQQESSWAELGPQLARIFAKRGERVTFVQGDAAVLFQEVARAIDIIRGAGPDGIGAGIENVGLLTPGVQRRN
ncbi:MAG: ExbD/TolR family protein [Candidatus Acidiferrales bacterium]